MQTEKTKSVPGLILPQPDFFNRPGRFVAYFTTDRYLEQLVTPRPSRGDLHAEVCATEADCRTNSLPTTHPRISACNTGIHRRSR
jgi:hypothetical protein